MLSALLREAGRTLSEEEARYIQLVHRNAYARQARPLCLAWYVRSSGYMGRSPAFHMPSR
jgi:hypothetical protein